MSGLSQTCSGSSELLVWPRDLAETAGALLAAEASGDAVRVLSYLESVQEADGHWPQNMWLDGTSYWTGR